MADSSAQTCQLIAAICLPLCALDRALSPGTNCQEPILELTSTCLWLRPNSILRISQWLISLAILLLLLSQDAGQPLLGRHKLGTGRERRTEIVQCVIILA
jgi:hypothetical protein